MNETLVEIFGYNLSYLEGAAVVTCVTCIWLASKGKVLNFLFGIVSTLLYMLFFYQARLYSSAILQIVFIVFNVYGYYAWTHPKVGEEDAHRELKISRCSGRMWAILLAIIAAGTTAWGWFISHPPTWVAAEFAEAQFPYIDAFVMVASITGQYLMAKKKLENWMIWIAVDVVATALYFASGAKFTGILYFVLILIACNGLYGWHKTYKSYTKTMI